MIFTQPVIMVHGGPGGGCSQSMRRYHDPDVYRIILVDQRGSGRSIPHACLEENTYDFIEILSTVVLHLIFDHFSIALGI
jgi:proline iminopeptidase